MTAIVLIVSALLVLADQLIKLWVLAALPGAPSVTLIPGLLQLTYVENRGAAFGIFQGRVGLLSIVTLAVIAVAVWLLISGKIRHKLAMWSVGLIVAAARQPDRPDLPGVCRRLSRRVAALPLPGLQLCRLLRGRRDDPAGGLAALPRGQGQKGPARSGSPGGRER